MIKVEKIETWGFEHAIRGMRNPMNSHDRLDSQYVIDTATVSIVYGIGKNDLKLMRQLYKAGTEHRKYLRQIFVSMDIIAPLYWWKEFDTYKIGTVANSCSTMHKIMSKTFKKSDFSFEKALVDEGYFDELLEVLNDHREIYLNYEKHRDDGELPNYVSKKGIFDSLIQLLPSSYNQKRTVIMSYENVFNMIHQRKNHKLDEWKEFVKILKDLPYVTEIGQFEEKGEENV